ncbi:mannitol dehydrogenase family protein [Nioella aestuarii]|uniref:mannitol dehydrogenase family protein n=1 Tax=Nioella aestuarii TaxID=1662864 RepID=UPI003D7FB707
MASAVHKTTSGLTALSNATLSDLPENVVRPGFDRSTLSPGIVHIGVGNFHRAHQAWYLNRLMKAGLAQDWAIVGAGVRPYDATMRDKLLAQDCLTTLIELDADHRSAEVIGSMIDYVPVAEDNAPLVAAMADPAIRIVAMTVTESGYFQTAEGLDTGHPDIVHDATHPNRPRTAFGAIIAALRLRRDAGAGPFTALSCDNLQGNGAILRRVVLGLARMSDPALADWIEHQCSFPNSMVDCIVPATGERELDFARAFGIGDAVPVSHEAFRQWVIEDDFCAGRPPLEQAGVTFSDSVHDYEMMKLRILNAGHQVVANAGALLGLETIAEATTHPAVGAFLNKVLSTEVAPHVPSVAEFTPAQYITLINRRFSNPSIVDTTRRVAFDGSSRHPGFVLPSLRDALAVGGEFSGLALAEALWARYCLGVTEAGAVIAANDPQWSSLTARAQEAATRPQAWLEMPAIYGDLANDARFASEFVGWMELIGAKGVEAALAAYTA